VGACEADAGLPCLWTQGLAETFRKKGKAQDEVMRLPIAHGEGAVCTSDRQSCGIWMANVRLR